MKKFFPLLLVFVLLFSLSACGDEPQYDYDSAETQEQEVDYPENENFYFGRGEIITPSGGSDVLIEYAEPIDCTKEALASWYKQDVAGTDFAYAILVYDDEENRGVYAADGVISRDVVIEDLSYTGDTDKTDVFVYNNGKLEKQ